MKFDLSVNNQAKLLEDEFKMKMYKGLHEAASQKKGWVRLTGLPVGIVSGLSTIATRIALIFENLIKGFGNIFGAPFSDKCSFKKGLNNLFVQVPKNIIMLPFSAIAAAISPADKMLGMLLNPQQLTEVLWVKHDPEKRQQIIAETEAAAKKQKEQEENLEADANADLHRMAQDGEAVLNDMAQADANADILHVAQPDF